jgi:hypothetical protein
MKNKFLFKKHLIVITLTLSMLAGHSALAWEWADLNPWKEEDDKVRDRYNQAVRELYQTYFITEANKFHQNNQSIGKDLARSAVDARNAYKTFYRKRTSLLGLITLTIREWGRPHYYEDFESRGQTSEEIMYGAFKTGGKDLGLTNNGFREILVIWNAIKSTGNLDIYPEHLDQEDVAWFKARANGMLTKDGELTEEAVLASYEAYLTKIGATTPALPWVAEKKVILPVKIEAVAKPAEAQVEAEAEATFPPNPRPTPKPRLIPDAPEFRPPPQATGPKPTLGASKPRSTPVPEPEPTPGAPESRSTPVPESRPTSGASEPRTPVPEPSPTPGASKPKATPVAPPASSTPKAPESSPTPEPGPKPVVPESRLTPGATKPSPTPAPGPRPITPVAPKPIEPKPIEPKPIEPPTVVCVSDPRAKEVAQQIERQAKQLALHTDVMNQFHTHVSGINERVKLVNNQVNKLEKDVQKNSKKAMRGIAAVAALGNAVFPSAPGKSVISAAIGGYQHAQAIAVSLSHRPEKLSRVSFQAGIGASTAGKPVMRVGAGYEF